jgi:hypothetical protein
LNDLRFTAENASDSGSANRQEVSNSAAALRELVFVSESEFKIRTDVDRKYQLMIRELYNTAMTIRSPDGRLIEERIVPKEAYIQYMTDVSRVIERAAHDQTSPEITQAIINLAMLGQELRKVERTSDLNVEMQNKRDQIRAVLRARDMRALNAEFTRNHP